MLFREVSADFGGAPSRPLRVVRHFTHTVGTALAAVRLRAIRESPLQICMNSSFCARRERPLCRSAKFQQTSAGRRVVAPYGLCVIFTHTVGTALAAVRFSGEHSSPLQSCVLPLVCTDFCGQMRAYAPTNCVSPLAFAESALARALREAPLRGLCTAVGLREIHRARADEGIRPYGVSAPSLILRAINRNVFCL